MGEWSIVQADVIDWCAEYDGPPFHAMLTDCPWEISFMGRKWDASGISFQPETWAALSEHLLPGAWIMVFAASRGWHRLACAIEDAGFVIQPSIFVEGVGVVDCSPMVLWLHAQAFPKSSNISKALDKRGGNVPNFEEFKAAVRERMKETGITRSELQEKLDNYMLSHYLTDGDQPAIPNWRDYQIIRDALGLNHKWDEIFKPPKEREVVGKDRSGKTAMMGGLQGVAHGGEYDLTAPATPLARAWEGHRYGGQILRDVACPIVCAQKPWGGNRLDDIVATGAGSLWVEGGRVACSDKAAFPAGVVSDTERVYGNGEGLHANRPRQGDARPSGRWPPNYCVMHHPACERVLVPAPCPACSGDGADGCAECGGSGEVARGAVQEVSGTGVAVRIRRAKEYNASSYSIAGPLPNATYASEDGLESVSRYRCARCGTGCGHWWLAEEPTPCPECGGEGEWACAVRRLGEDSGEKPTPSTYYRATAGEEAFAHGIYGSGKLHPQIQHGYGDKGTAARFYLNPDFSHETSEALAQGPIRKYQAKPSRRERDAGLDGSQPVWYNKAHTGGGQWENTDQGQSTPAELDGQQKRDTIASACGTAKPKQREMCSCTTISGSKPTGQSPKDIASTTRIGTSKTTGLKTSSLLTSQLTSEFTEDANSETACGGNPAEPAGHSSQLTKSTGTYPKKGGPNTGAVENATSLLSVGKGEHVKQEGLSKEVQGRVWDRNPHPT